MNKLSQFFLIIIAVLVGVIGVEQCRSFQKRQKPEIIKMDGKTYDVINRKIDTVYITKTSIVYRPGKKIPYKVLVEKPVYIPAKIDTNAVINAYFAKVIYKDTLRIDKIGYISVTDTLNKNKISGRSYSYEFKLPTIKDYMIIKEPPHNQFYIGGNILVGNNKVFAGPQILWKTKADNIYGVNGYIDPYGSQYYGLSLNFKIKLKK
jgi:predicted RNA methylase